jgi:recombinational DNA repair protein (RecF pathway)
MSYAVYTTRGFILNSGPTGEASKLYSIYTEDFGLIRAKAQGVRLIQSKLRYALEDYSLCTFSLVKGKEVWRLTGSQAEIHSKESSLIRARILNLVRRLVQGEEKNQSLFNALLKLTDKDIPDEVSALTQILSILGYLDLASIEGKSEREVLMAINKAIKETQL